ncbi:MAG: macrolide family glycosyltransferase [Erysipelotrichaceae bacterium]
MRTIVFFNLPAHGHINPTLAVVETLVARGHNVIYYAFDEFKAKIEATGATYRCYPYDSSGLEPHKLTNFFRLMEKLLELSEVILPPLEQELRAQDVDLIVHDSLCPWGKLLAKRLALPAVDSVTTFALNQHVVKTLTMSPSVLKDGLISLPSILSSFKRIKRLKKQGYAIGNLPDLLINEQSLNLVYTSRSFQPLEKTFDDRYAFVGPSLSTRLDRMDELEALDSTKPLIYISLGTIVNQNLAFYHACFEAFHNVDATFILSIGKQMSLEALGPVPTNFIVKRHVAQLEVLKRSALFITHGGMNSVHEALMHQVPMLVVPGQNEQEMVARQVQACGAGIHLTQLSAASLAQHATTLLTTPSYKENAKALQRSLQEAGGPQKAASLIEQYLH